ncbi:MAG: hypothetical protein Q4E29_08420 [Lachnospiraceae bacterium]|nr:hypothetical protein [Lachnospiraceae bacterium]
MLKIRLMGTKQDIKCFLKMIQDNRQIEVLEISELYSIKGSNRYYRAYVEVQSAKMDEKE